MQLIKRSNPLFCLSFYFIKHSYWLIKIIIISLSHKTVLNRASPSSSRNFFLADATLCTSRRVSRAAEAAINTVHRTMRLLISFLSAFPWFPECLLRQSNLALARNQRTSRAREGRRCCGAGGRGGLFARVTRNIHPSSFFPPRVDESGGQYKCRAVAEGVGRSVGRYGAVRAGKRRPVLRRGWISAPAS